MNLILDVPVSFATRILSEWLKLKHTCKLDVAMCSAKNRLGMGPIYEALTLKNCAMDSGIIMDKQFDWFLIRKIRLSSLYVVYPLPMGAISKVSALLKHSQIHLQDLDIYENQTLLNAMIGTVCMYCSRIKNLQMTKVVHRSLQCWAICII